MIPSLNHVDISKQYKKQKSNTINNDIKEYSINFYNQNHSYVKQIIKKFK